MEEKTTQETGEVIGREQEIARELSKPFPWYDIEWRVARSWVKKNTEKCYVHILAYLTNRAFMQRLDDVVGMENWKNEFKEGPCGGVLCGLSLRINGEWVTKWDGAENTEFEAVKGGLSDAMKRAGVQWGIGRYLYNLPKAIVNVLDNGERWINDTKSGVKGYWTPPELPAWALPEGSGNPHVAYQEPKPVNAPVSDADEPDDTQTPPKPPEANTGQSRKPQPTPDPSQLTENGERSCEAFNKMMNILDCVLEKQIATEEEFCRKVSTYKRGQKTYYKASFDELLGQHKSNLSKYGENKAAFIWLRVAEETWSEHLTEAEEMAEDNLF